jgi:hypothetical protein
MTGPLRRRAVLGIGGGIAAATVLGTTPSWAAPAGRPGSPRFDLTAPSSLLIREKALQNATVLQAFAFDNTNRRIYAVQLMQGGITLAGEPGPVSGADRARNGDLCLTQLDLAGNRLGAMYLKGFGHGVQIGAEPVGRSTYVWCEAEGVSDGTNAWGRSLGRFKFVNGQILTSGSAGVDLHRPIPAATSTTCAIDPVNNRLVMRYRLDDAPRITAYDLAAVRAGVYRPLATVDQPAVVAPVEQPFQGYAALGRYLYLYEGAAYGKPGSVPPTGNTYITCVDLETGAVLDRQLTKAGYSLDYREPEGMAIQLTRPGQACTARLCMGFASGVTGARMASIYYKSALI